MITTTLGPGARLGPYEIESLLGTGGMGEVYRARDTRLERVVAIKILRADVPGHAPRRDHFLAEARALSALTHPHIRGIHDVGCDNGLDFLVMEYVEGETLDRHLARRPMPIARALTCAVQIADALDAAHRHGTMHGDVKPGNIILASSGAKLLDFGIARLVATPDTTDSSTVTDTGAIAGTTPYMAPEQLEGRHCDPRSDLFALGIVIYQMIAGRRPFDSPTRARLIASILEHEPAPLTSPHDTVPPALERLVMKCLAKDADERWQTARDLSSELAWIANTTSANAMLAATTPASTTGHTAPHATPRIGRRARMAWVVATAVTIVAAVLAGGAWMGRGAPAAAVIHGPVRFVADAPIGSVMAVSPGGFSVSPDGRHLVFVGSAGTGTRLLWLRSLDSFETHTLPGTDDAWNPFWAPDSQSIAFSAGGQLRRIDLGANRVRTICDIDGTVYGTWAPDGTILMSNNAGPSRLLRVPGSGGEVSEVPTPESLRGGLFQGPEFLPDGHHYVFHVRLPAADRSGLYVASLETGGHQRLVSSDSQGLYAEPGYLVHVKGGALMAQPFDPRTLAVTGEPVPLPEPVSFVPGINRGSFSISRGGVLAYRGRVEASDLLWLDRAGRVVGSLLPTGPYVNPALSPDGTRVAVTKGDPPAGTSDVWLIDSNGAVRQLTSGPAVENFPTWSPDGRRVLYTSDRDGSVSLYQKDTNAGASDRDEPVVLTHKTTMPFDWSRDGRFILYSTFTGRGMLGARFWVLPMGESGPIELPALAPIKEEGQGQISPDGRWLAYVSDVNGSPQVFVRPFPTGAGRWLISATGGFEPKWRADGSELFYLASDQMLMSTDIIAGPTFSAAQPRPLFRTSLMGAYLGSPFPNGRVRNEYAVTPDGQRFLINQPVGGSSAYAVRVVVNWPALMER